MTTAQQNKLAKCKKVGFNAFRTTYDGSLIVFLVIDEVVNNVRVYGLNGVQKNLDSVKFNTNLLGTETKF